MESKGPIDRRERDPADPSSHTLYATPTQESGTATPTSGEATPMDTTDPEPGLLKHTVLCPYESSFFFAWYYSGTSSYWTLGTCSEFFLSLEAKMC